MKKYIVIGSNCFTGSHIVDALVQNPENQVIGISRSPEYKDFFLPYKKRSPENFTFHQIELVHQFPKLLKLMDAEKPQIVINVAALSEVALSNERPVEYFETNTTAVVKLCNYLRTVSWLERYIHISSAEIFGPCPEPLKEDDPFRPSTPYAVSKAAADMYLHTIQKNFKFPATLIRSTNVYGRHQQLFKIIPRTVIYRKQGKKLQLHGGGTSMKSFIHIRDVVDGLMLAIAKEKSGTFHFSVPSNQKVADVVRITCELMGHKFEEAVEIVGERLGQDSRYWLDCTKAHTELGWEAKVPFKDGVRETIEWIEQNWPQIQHEPLNYVHKV